VVAQNHTFLPQNSNDIKKTNDAMIVCRYKDIGWLMIFVILF
jgi:hypothetical protein